MVCIMNGTLIRVWVIGTSYCDDCRFRGGSFRVISMLNFRVIVEVFSGSIIFKSKIWDVVCWLWTMISEVRFLIKMVRLVVIIVNCSEFCKALIVEMGSRLIWLVRVA